MKRSLTIALVLLCASAFADPPATPPADAPLAVVVVSGTFLDPEGLLHQVTGGAYEPHELLLTNAKRFEELEWENGTLRVLIGVSIAVAVAAVGLAAYEWNKAPR